MAKLYLIVGQEFQKRGTVDELNTLLGECGLTADPCESERNFEKKWKVGNIRRRTDPEGTQRFDSINIRSDDFICGIIIGHILGYGSSSGGISHSYWPVSTDLEEIESITQSLQDDFPDAKVYAMYACAKDVRKTD